MKKKLAALAAAIVLFVLLPIACLAAQGKAHYLLVGVDGWGLNEEGSARSDAIILATLDYDAERIVLISMARDALVQPSFRKNPTKLNTLVRSSQGDHALVEYVEETFSIPISGYFLVNFSGAVDVINAIGGVEIDLTEKEMQDVRKRAGYYDGFPLQAGVCRLNGAQALIYMRCRILDNDFGRQNRQANVLRAAFNELSSLSVLEAMKLLGCVLGMYRTDLSILDQAALVKDALGLRNAQMETHSFPAEGTYRFGKDSKGLSAVTFDLTANQELMWEWMGVQPPEA